MKRSTLLGWLLAPVLYGCPSAVVETPDAGHKDATVDAGPPPDAGEPEDAGITPDSGTRTVRATNIAPSLGTARGTRYSVSGRIPPPTSLGTAASPSYTVTGGAGGGR